MVELVVNVNVELVKVGVLFYQLKNLIFNSREKKDGWRLSCQVAVKNDLGIYVPDDIFGVKEWECEVLSNNVATFIEKTCSPNCRG